MMKRRFNSALIAGLALAAVHFIAICALASIVVRHQHSENAAEYWQYAGLFDVPVSLVLLLFSPFLPLLPDVANAPDVAFLPGIIGSCTAADLVSR